MLAVNQFMKKALLVSAFFIVALYSFYSLKQPTGATSNDCSLDSPGIHLGVKSISDGDTVLLANGRKLRLLGINTPELEHGKKPDDAYAKAAKDRLSELLKLSDMQVQLKYGEQDKDRYGRLLAYTYLRDGRSVNATLLAEGLAVLVAIPPNLSGVECHLAIENRAKQQKLAIWSLPRYQGISIKALLKTDGGYYAVKGRITGVRQSKDRWWLNMGQQFELSLQKQDLADFGIDNPSQLKNRQVIVDGWISKRGKRYRLRLQHPTQWALLP